MSTVSELLGANLHDVFGTRDEAARRAAIARVYAEDVAFTDPEGTVTGHDALAAKAAAILSGVPESFEFAEAGPRYVSGSTGVLAWAFGPAGAPVVRGVDVITVEDGRIASLRTLLAESE